MKKFNKNVSLEEPIINYLLEMITSKDISWSIAHENNISINNLKRINKLTSNLLFIG